MNQEKLKARTKRFAHLSLDLVNELPRSAVGAVISRQLAASATSVGANYRAACRARSAKEMYAKLRTVLEEVDESAFWIELIIERQIVARDRVHDLLAEANELTAITVASLKTLERKMNAFHP